MKGDPTLWLIARASGVTAYVVLTAAVLAGLTVRSRPFGRSVRTASATDVHRFLTLVALGALVLHGAALAFDRTVRIGAAGLFVPGLSAYRPAAVAAGVLSAELAVLVVASFSLRRRIGMRNWRRFHWATYLIFVMATLHGLAAGTDSTRPWAFDLYLGAIGAVVFAAAWRALSVSVKPSAGGTHVQDRDRPLAL